MIKYNIICKSCNKKFDSWFSSSKEYEKLKKYKHLNCLYCNSIRVEKSIMSPSIKSFKNKEDFIIDNKKIINIKKKIKAYQKFIKENFEYVGDNFSYKARSLHYKKVKNQKGIYGKASKKDILDLQDEGINTDVIPWFSDKEN
ncbi:MAG: hypothetical protein CBE35_00400 [Candidatus Pelagibacter sp. TMED275]|nr:MAG: hypothetical protein CBE35_00400 [Candidatus Pelagibacter sp. TMED275]|tara:strand:+ start:1349 stop:1777 length:429 start_codon:yes stop_codon:yes gene_type:complete